MPDNPRAHNNLGLVYRGLGRLDDAAAAFQKAIDLEPTFIRFRNLGMVLAEAGSTRRPSRRSDDRSSMRPNQYRAWGLLASVYANQHADAAKVRDTYLKAIALAADLLKQTPKDEYLLADVGGYYAARREWKRRACRCSRRRPRLRQDDPEVLYQVAVGYEMARTTATRPSVILQKREPAAILPRRLRENPLLESRFALTRDTARSPPRIADASTKGEM